MLLFMVVLRALVIQKGIRGGKIPPWYGGIFGWLIRIIRPKAKEDEPRPYQVLALVAICLILLLDTVIRGLDPGGIAASLVASPMNWRMTAFAFFVSLPLFGVSIFKIPIPFEEKDYDRFKIKRLPPLVFSQRFLWLLAAFASDLRQGRVAFTAMADPRVSHSF